jgi:phosphoribosyl 1,2-cyclic phosphate phosphodiesterase
MHVLLPSRNLQNQLLILGTGTSHGVPMIGCGCATCLDPNPKNKRGRCSVALGLPEGTLLIDTPPDLRTQLLRERVSLVDTVIYTHEHADHLFGLDDLRIFANYLGHELPVYCSQRVEARIRRSFDYAFDDATRHYQAGGLPKLVLRRIETQPVEILGARITPIPLQHGRYEVLGFRVGDVAYCTDTNGIPAASLPLLEGLEILILDALRRSPHPTHFSLEEAVDTARRLRPRRTFFTHICHDLEHEATNALLPPGMELAYDGLVLPLGEIRNKK